MDTQAVTTIHEKQSLNPRAVYPLSTVAKDEKVISYINSVRLPTPAVRYPMAAGGANPITIKKEKTINKI